MGILYLLFIILVKVSCLEHFWVHFRACSISPPVIYRFRAIIVWGYRPKYPWQRAIISEMISSHSSMRCFNSHFSPPLKKKNSPLFIGYLETYFPTQLSPSFCVFIFSLFSPLPSITFWNWTCSSLQEKRPLQVLCRAQGPLFSHDTANQHFY